MSELRQSLCVCTWHPDRLTCDVCGAKGPGALIESTAICAGCLAAIEAARSRSFAERSRGNE